jgi:hypothetical protein
LLADGGDGTNIDAGAAVGTFGRINLVFSVRSFRDGTGFTNSGAGAASDTFVGSYFVRHIFS